MATGRPRPARIVTGAMESCPLRMLVRKSTIGISQQPADNAIPKLAKQSQSVHGQAMKDGVADAPVCIDCHGEHLILGPKEPGSLVNASRVSMATCGRCHSDERLDCATICPPTVFLPTPTVITAWPCGVDRRVLPTALPATECTISSLSTDPRSTVNAANLSKTCGNCHAGAGDHFVIGPVHVRTTTGAAHPVVKWIRWTYLALIPLTLGFMILHNLIDFLAKLIRRQPRHESDAKVIAHESEFPHRPCRRDS